VRPRQQTAQGIEPLVPAHDASPVAGALMSGSTAQDNPSSLDRAGPEGRVDAHTPGRLPES
jgi:hypothetical protein